MRCTVATVFGRLQVPRRRLRCQGCWHRWCPAEPPKTLKKAITYRENQRDWIGSYEQWRKQDYLVESEMIERAVALVINHRMKKRGMC